AMDDFIMTIEDDTEIKTYNEEENEENDNSPMHKENKDSRKRKKKEKKASINEDISLKKNDINPDFSFSFGDDNFYNDVEGWDFVAARAGLKPKLTRNEARSSLILNTKTNGRNNSKQKKTNNDQSLKISDKDNENNTSENDDTNFGAGTQCDIYNDENESSENDEDKTDEDDDDQMSSSTDEYWNNHEDHDNDSNSESSSEDEDEKQKEYFADESEIIHYDNAESFQTMNLSRPILKGLSQLGFIQPTPIQRQTIPIALMGRDICGGAITGSGKTAAFLVPVIERLLYRPRKTPSVRVLILIPTRELAIQCHRGLNLKKQESELRARPDIIIATPGRLIDHVRNSPSFSLDTIEILIIDEADRMLEDGFSAELNEIVKNCPKSRQTMLFSATMTDNVDELIRLSLNRPVRLMIDPTKATAVKLIQEFVRVRKHREEDRPSMLVALCKKTFRRKVIIFFKNKATAHEMKIIFGLLGLKAAELHGSLSQEQRMEALETFRDGKVDFLLATNLASRGLDIKGIETVINYDMPQSYEHYIHRVGRTARAGRDRKILKMVIKHAKGQIRRRNIDAEIVSKYREKFDKLKNQIKEEIFSKPARTWFQSKQEKQKSKLAAKEQSNSNVETSETSKKRKREKTVKLKSKRDKRAKKSKSKR
ncbi:15431_t:CDS:10, partial [Racocetra fulgida]